MLFKYLFMFARPFLWVVDFGISFYWLFLVGRNGEGLGDILIHYGTVVIDVVVTVWAEFEFGWIDHMRRCDDSNRIDSGAF